MLTFCREAVLLGLKKLLYIQEKGQKVMLDIIYFLKISFKMQKKKNVQNVYG